MPKTLLLADDSVTIQKVVGISFANEDVVLLTVDNGDDAIARAREARPDLVLADVMMPGKDGYEVCETLKADPELRHVPVLLLSGTFEPFDEERARRAGADGHITKPFEAQALVDQVNALLARAPQPSPAAPSEATVMVEAAGDSAFDFFDEELAQTSPAPPGMARPPSAAATNRAADATDAFELEAVEDEAPAAPPAEPGFPDAGDSQATVLFEDDAPNVTRRSPSAPPFLGDGFDAEALETPAPEAAPTAADPNVPAPAGYEESFDFGFDDGATTAAALVEPPAPTPPPLPAREAPPAPLFEGDFDEPAAARPVEAREPVEPIEAIEVMEPLAAMEPVHSMEAEPLAPPALADLVPPPVPDLAPPPPSPPLAVRVSGPTGLSEAAQKQLQETLEKVVWEAFGDLSERIVRDVIERVEAVAWEVIPQMAETLIREEIRRLQEDDGEGA